MKEFAWNLMRNDLKSPDVVMENENSVNFNADLLPMEEHAVVETLKSFFYGRVKILEVVANEKNGEPMDMSLVHTGCFESGIEMVVDKVNVLLQYCLKSKNGDDVDCTKDENLSSALLFNAQLRSKCTFTIAKRPVGKGWTDLRDLNDKVNWRCTTHVGQLDFDRDGKSKTKNHYYDKPFTTLEHRKHGYHT